MNKVFDGSIDKMKIYPEALSASKVMELYQGETGAMSESAELTAEEVLYKSWEGKTIAPEGVVVHEDWALEIIFTDGTKFHLWVAQDSLHVERHKC